MEIIRRFEHRLTLFVVKRRFRRYRKSLHTVDVTITFSEMTLFSDLGKLQVLRDGLLNQFIDNPDSLAPIVDWSTITLLDHIVERVNSVVANRISGKQDAHKTVHRNKQPH